MQMCLPVLFRVVRKDLPLSTCVVLLMCLCGNPSCKGGFPAGRFGVTTSPSVRHRKICLKKSKKLQLATLFLWNACLNKVSEKILCMLGPSATRIYRWTKLEGSLSPDMLAVPNKFVMCLEPPCHGLPNVPMSTAISIFRKTKCRNTSSRLIGSSVFGAG